MKRTQLTRRTPLRAAKPERFFCPDCEREVEGSTCETCLGPAGPILTGRPVAKPKRPRDPIPAHTRAALAERSGGVCEWCFVARATDAHHLQLRRGGDHSLENLLHLCSHCHGWVHANPEQSRRLGLMRSQYGGAA